MKKISFLLTLIVILGLWVRPILAQSTQTATPSLEQTAETLLQQLPSVKVLPGQALYWLETLKEKIAIFTTFGAKNQAQLYLKFAEKRLAEYQALKARSKEQLAQRALEMYTEELNQAVKKLEATQGQKLPADEAVNQAAEATQKHLQILQNLYQQAPEPAKQGLERAMEASQKGYSVVQQLLSGQQRPEIQTKTKETKTKIEQSIGKFIQKLWPAK